MSINKRRRVVSRTSLASVRTSLGSMLLGDVLGLNDVETMLSRLHIRSNSDVSAGQLRDGCDDARDAYSQFR